jgi:hypothetical protein
MSTGCDHLCGQLPLMQGVCGGVTTVVHIYLWFVSELWPVWLVPIFTAH